MADQSFSSNPYTPFAPATNGRLFFGREAVFDWLRQELAGPMPGQPLILGGRAHIGKTSILKQIEAGRLGPQFAAVYVDLSATAQDSHSALLWDIASGVFLALGRRHINLPQLSQADFVADPYKAFHQQLLQPALAALNGRTLLLLFDNLDVPPAPVNDNQQALPLLYGLIDSHEHAGCIFALEQTDNGQQPWFPFLENARLYEIGPLTAEAATALVRQPVNYTIVKDVAHYIVDLTRGYPYETQRLCHALYERQRHLNLSHITVADVAIVKEAALGIDNEKSTTTDSPIYKLTAHPSLAQTIHRVGWRHRRQRRNLLRVIAALLVLATGLALANSLIGRNLLQQPGVAAGSDTPTAGALVASLENSSDGAGAIAVASSTATGIAQPQLTPMPPAATESSPTETAILTPTPPVTLSPTASPTPSPTPSRYPPVLTRTQDNMSMILIPAGRFFMGSAGDDFMAAPDERPQHEVRLNRFYIDKYEVSVDQYAAFLNRLGGYERACSQIDCVLPREIAGYTSYLSEQDLGDGTVQYVPVVGYASYPANHVSWHGAVAYCEWVGARLPTEAEWEYAARADDGWLYPWGNTAPDPNRAVFQSENFDNLKPVDALPDGASPFGIFGMAGSVWEWTADWYDEDYYSVSPINNPTGPETGFSRVIRGGAWPNNNQADRIRTANRSSLTPDFISSTVGFRCARTP